MLPTPYILSTKKTTRPNDMSTPRLELANINDVVKNKNINKVKKNKKIKKPTGSVK